MLYVADTLIAVTSAFLHLEKSKISYFYFEYLKIQTRADLSG